MSHLGVEFASLFHTSVEDEFSGVIGETVKQICLEAELDCHFRMRPVSRAYQEIERGVAQALITVQFDRFNKCCIKSDWSSLLLRMPEITERSW